MAKKSAKKASSKKSSSKKATGKAPQLSSVSTLHKVMESVAMKPVGKGFQFAIIEHSKDAASYLVTPRSSKKKFVQIVSLVLNQDGFVGVEIFVSNLSVTEIWAEIQISVDYAGQYLTEMLTIVKQELSKTISTDAQFETTLNQIDKGEIAREKLIAKLSVLEKQINAKPSDKALSKDLGKVEADCIHQEIDISKLTYRYFVNALDEVDPFFFGMLF